MEYSSISKSVIGKKHLLNNIVCQDSSFSGESNGVVFSIVCDGCGSKKHSEIGSAQICKILFDKITNDFDLFYELNDQECVKEINNYVLSEMIAFAKSNNVDVSEYLSTYLFVATKGEKYIACRCGDGGIILYYKDGSYGVMVEEKEGYANETIYFNSSRCVEKMDIDKGPIPLLGAFIYCDGINVFLSSEQEIKNIILLMKIFSKNTKDQNELELDKLLNVAINKNDDDCTIGFVVASKSDFQVDKSLRVEEQLNSGIKMKRATRFESLKMLEHFSKRKLLKLGK